jgi:glycosidase
MRRELPRFALIPLALILALSRTPARAESPAPAADPIQLQYGTISVKKGSATGKKPMEFRPRWWSDSVFYQIFPRSFFDSNGDGIGDLAGITEKLDLLNSGKPDDPNSLGINGIWLTPIFDSPSYHGYDVRDYFHLQKEFGSLAEFRELIVQADKRGVRIILDLMLNHVSSEHPWFIESARNAKSPKREWFLWKKNDPGWSRPWNRAEPVWQKFGPAFYYALFSPDMPDLNFKNQVVLNEFAEIAKFWLGMGVAGFRLDAIKHLIETADGKMEHSPETHGVLRRFIAEVRRDYPEALFVGEIWDGPDSIARYIDGEKELDLAFDFNSSGGILRSVIHSEPKHLLKAIEENRSFLPWAQVSAPILTNHDMDRTATILRNHVGQMKLAAALMLAMPGTPFIYNGEEIGEQNSRSPGDKARRAPIPWSTGCTGFSQSNPWIEYPPCEKGATVMEQIAQPDSLRNHYRKLIAARRSNPALSVGAITEAIELAAQPGVVVIQRTVNRQKAYIVANLTATRSIAPEFPVSGQPRQVFPAPEKCVVHPTQSGSCSYDGKSIALPKLEAYEARFFVVDAKQ